MSDQKPIDVESEAAEKTSTALVAVGNIPPPVVAPVQTPAQARIEAVSNVLYKAYEKASTLVLSPEECEKLKADFPDEAFKLGAGGNPNLIYIEHAHLRDRFDSVFGMGQWALVRSKPHWAEEFVTEKGGKAVRIYADCALLIRGCLVSEAIGDMVYYPNNPTQNYGDAAEGSETAAFRRCAKKIGVGLQAWKKDFCAAWEAKNRKRPVRSWQPGPSQDTNPATKAAPGKPQEARKATKDENGEAEKNRLLWKEKFLKTFSAPERKVWAWSYAVRKCWILPTETLEDVPVDKVPITMDALKAVAAEIAKAADEVQGAVPQDLAESFEAAYLPPATAEIPENTQVPRDEDAGQPAEDEWWRDVAVHFGKNQGELIGEMEKNYLFGWWANWEPKPFKGRISEADKKFREALDAAGEHYGFKQPD